MQDNIGFSDFARIQGKLVVAAVRGSDYSHPGEEKLIDNFDKKRDQLLKIFPENIYLEGRRTYAGLYQAFREKILGAGIFYAKRLA